MERKLASIQRVRKVHQIKGADNIVCVQINGWECVAKKNEFIEGDLCVYFEVDSFLPNDQRYEFLKDLKTHQGKQGYRLRTIKLRGQISQGLALPLSMFPEIINPVELQDVTDILEVIKYDNSIAEMNNDNRLHIERTKGKFPNFLKKTDQERIQNLTDWFDRYSGLEWEETLKLDGSSMTCYKIKRELSLLDKIKKLFGVSVKPYIFGVCSRNLELKSTDNYPKTFDNNGKVSEYKQSDFWRAATKYQIEQYLPEGYAIQGELIAPNIQSNHEKVSDIEFYVFDVFDIKNQEYLLPKDRVAFVAQYLPTVKHIPILGTVRIFTECKSVSELLERVKGESMNTGTISEGRVYKSCCNGMSFKCINNEYLLKCEK